MALNLLSEIIDGGFGLGFGRAGTFCIVTVSMGVDKFASIVADVASDPEALLSCTEVSFSSSCLTLSSRSFEFH